MQDKIIKNLVKYGLSETEARVYSATLALDGENVDKIANSAGVNRTSCYPILERLTKTGLVSSAKKRGKTIFKAAPPEKFFDLLDEKKESVENIMDDLKSLFEINRGRPDVRYYEGEEGLKTVLNSIINEAKEMYIFGESESFLKALPGWMDNYVNKRVAKNIRVHIILKATPVAVKAAQKIKQDGKMSKYIKIRLLPEAYRTECSSFDVYNNKVALYSFQKPYNAVVIESKIINQLMRTVFNILWDVAEKYEHLAK